MPKKTIKKLITSLSSQLIESVRRRAGQRARGSGMADPRLSDSDLKEREGEGERDRAVDCLCSALLAVPVGRSVGRLTLAFGGCYIHSQFFYDWSWTDGVTDSCLQLLVATNHLKRTNESGRARGA